MRAKVRKILHICKCYARKKREKRKQHRKICVCAKNVVSLHRKTCVRICAARKARMKIIVVIGLLIAAVALLSVGVILRKDHSFRSQHIHQNERMKQDGIHCATSLDKEAERKAKRKINVKQL